MNNNSDYSKLIDDYLKGNLSETDKSFLENQMATDPALKGEVDIQRDILGVIRDARRAELKTVLANTHVGWYHMIPTAWRIAVTASIITIAGLTAYYLLPGSNNPSTTVKPDSAVEAVIETSPEASDTDIASQRSIEDAAVSNNNPAMAIKPAPALTDISRIAQREDETAELVIPQPDLDDNSGNLESDGMNTDDGKETDDLNSSNEISSEIVTVSTEKDANHEFHYTFNEGSLMLYGNFEGNPYEILEVNSSNGKRYFLYYNSQYFNLRQNTMAISPLVLVTDENLVSELEILKSNK